MGRFLKRGRLATAGECATGDGAHPTDPLAFRAEVQNVCQLYEQAPELKAQGVHVISSDVR